MNKNNNILLIWDRIGDYHRARCTALSDLIENNGLFTADLGSADNLYKWTNTTKTSHKHFILSDKNVEQKDISIRVKGFLKIIKENNINTVCLAGYGRFEYILFAIIARIKGIKTLMFAESWYKSNFVLELFKKTLIRLLYDSLFVSGIKAEQYYTQSLNIKNKKLRKGYSVVDNAHFENKGFVEKKDEILCIARFSKEKNLKFLIQAFQNSRISENHHLKIIGGGNQKQELEYLIQNSKKISLQDWITYEELPQAYAQAKIFILPSTFEPWGLVVNEAMAAGLPVIVSEQCGCQPDLVDINNGFVFDANNINSLIECFNQIVPLSTEKLEQMGNFSKAKIKDYTPEIWAKNLLKLINN